MFAGKISVVIVCEMQIAEVFNARGSWKVHGWFNLGSPWNVQIVFALKSSTQPIQIDLNKNYQKFHFRYLDTCNVIYCSFTNATLVMVKFLFVGHLKTLVSVFDPNRSINSQFYLVWYLIHGPNVILQVA